MKILCFFGLHRWRTKLTARPGTTVSRCLRCDQAKVKHRRKR